MRRNGLERPAPTAEAAAAILRGAPACRASSRPLAPLKARPPVSI